MIDLVGHRRDSPVGSARLGPRHVSGRGHSGSSNFRETRPRPNTLTPGTLVPSAGRMKITRSRFVKYSRYPRELHRIGSSVASRDPFGDGRGGLVQWLTDHIDECRSVMGDGFPEYRGKFRR